MPRHQSISTTIRHLNSIVSKGLATDFTSHPEDAALLNAISKLRQGQILVKGLLLTWERGDLAGSVNALQEWAEQ